MRQLGDVTLEPHQLEALEALRRQLYTEFDIERLILYGSVARGEADEESDIDLLVVTGQPLSHRERHQVVDIVFEINLVFDTNFSVLDVDSKSWESGPLSVLPLKKEISRDGVQL